LVPTLWCVIVDWSCAICGAYDKGGTSRSDAVVGSPGSMQLPARCEVGHRTVLQLTVTPASAPLATLYRHPIRYNRSSRQVTGRAVNCKAPRPFSAIVDLGGLGESLSGRLRGAVLGHFCLKKSVQKHGCWTFLEPLDTPLDMSWTVSRLTSHRCPLAFDCHWDCETDFLGQCDHPFPRTRSCPRLSPSA
jgi:hypothetical protein